MTSQRRIIRLLLTTTALLLTGLSLFKIIPSRADYTGPDRTITTYSWQRRVCRYQAVYDPDGPGWYGCSLTLYEPPESSCPATGSVGEYFNPTACPGWPGSCTALPCDISLSSSVDGCSEGDPGCRSVAHTTTLPEATVSGSISCDTPGNNSWCRGAAVLDLSGSEPLDGYSILALEGTHNGVTFACSGDACQLPLAEGANDFTFWAISSYGDTSNMGSASANLDTQPPGLVLNSAASFCPNCGELLDIQIQTADALSGVNAWELRTGATIITSGGTATGQTFSWDGSGLAAGTHTLMLQGQDAAGNTSSTTHAVTIVLPAAGPPKRSASTATARPMAISHTATPSGTSTPTYAAEIVFALSLPTPTRITVSIPFGGRPSIPVSGSEGHTPGALPGLDPQTATNAGTTTTNPVLWGGAAAALVAAAMAVGAAERRRRKVKAQRLAREMARRNAAAEAREQAQAQAEAQARRMREEMEAQKAAQWKSRAEAFRQDEELIEGLKTEHRTGSTPAATQPRSWWQRAWEGVKSIFTSSRNQQTLTSTGTPGATPTPQPGVYAPAQTGTPTPPGFNIPSMTRAPAPPGQELLRDPDLWQRFKNWGRERIENLVWQPPALISLSYNQTIPLNTIRNFTVDEWVSYQPLARNLIESISYQSVTLDHIHKVKITSNPSAHLDFNLANGRITFRGKERPNGRRLDVFVQPFSLSAGSRMVLPFIGPDPGPIREISVSTYDVDILGPNWLSLKVSQGYGETISTLHQLERGDFQISDTRITQIGMKVIRYPRLVIVAGVVALVIEGGIVLAPVVISALEIWSRVYGVP